MRQACCAFLSTVILTLGLTAMTAAEANAAPSAAEETTAPAILQHQSVLALEGEGISSSQAKEDLEVQQRAGNIVETLQSALGVQYAGVWFDNQTGRFSVGIAPDASETAARRAMESAGVLDATTFVAVKHTQEELNSAATAVGASVRSTGNLRQASVVARDALNAIVVEVDSNLEAGQVSAIETATRTAVNRFAVPYGAQPVETVTVPVPTTALEAKATSGECQFPNCNLPARGGVRVFSQVQNGYYATCTTGFFVKDHNEYPYVLTAGHCFYGEPLWGSGTWAIANAENTFGYTLGKPVAYAWGSGKDVGVIESDTYIPEPYVAVWEMNGSGPTGPASEPQHPVLPTPLKAYEGLTECHIGEHSGTDCGEVKLVNIDIEEAEEGFPNMVVEHVDKLCAYGLKGDSGGPTVAGDSATGIDVAGNLKPCSEGGAVYIYEMEPAMETVGVHMGGTYPVIPSTKVAFQANTTDLYIDTHGVGENEALGMASGTSPSINSTGETAFQANNGELYIEKAGVGHAQGLAMASGTSPSINSTGEVAYQASNGELYLDKKKVGKSQGTLMAAGTSPSMNEHAEIAFHGHNGDLFVEKKGVVSDEDLVMGTSSSPSINSKGEVAYQAASDELSILKGSYYYLQALGMSGGTSPSINEAGEVAFQANTGDLYIDRYEPVAEKGVGHNQELGVASGTSPSINNKGEVAFQGENSGLYIDRYAVGHNQELGMASGTSPCMAPTS